MRQCLPSVSSCPCLFFCPCSTLQIRGGSGRGVGHPSYGGGTRGDPPGGLPPPSQACQEASGSTCDSIWAPGCTRPLKCVPKASIVWLWNQSWLHFGSSFGAFLGSGCKSENGAAVEARTLLRPSMQTPKSIKQQVYFEGPLGTPFSSVLEARKEENAQHVSQQHPSKGTFPGSKNPGTLIFQDFEPPEARTGGHAGPVWVHRSHGGNHIGYVIQFVIHCEPATSQGGANIEYTSRPESWP